MSVFLGWIIRNVPCAPILEEVLHEIVAVVLYPGKKGNTVLQKRGTNE